MISLLHSLSFLTANAQSVDEVKSSPADVKTHTIALVILTSVALMWAFEYICKKRFSKAQSIQRYQKIQEEQIEPERITQAQMPPEKPDPCTDCLAKYFHVKREKIWDRITHTVPGNIDIQLGIAKLEFLAFKARTERIDPAVLAIKLLKKYPVDPYSPEAQATLQGLIQHVHSSYNRGAQFDQAWLNALRISQPDLMAIPIPDESGMTNGERVGRRLTIYLDQKKAEIRSAMKRDLPPTTTPDEVNAAIDYAYVNFTKKFHEDVDNSLRKAYHNVQKQAAETFATANELKRGTRQSLLLQRARLDMQGILKESNTRRERLYGQLTEGGMQERRRQLNAYLIFNQMPNATRGNFAAFYLGYCAAEADCHAARLSINEPAKAQAKQPPKKTQPAKITKAVAKPTAAKVAQDLPFSTGSVSTTPEQQRAQQLQTWLSQGKHRTAARVRRWDTTNADTVRGFTDRKNGVVVHHYEAMVDEDIQKQMWMHGATGTEHLVTNPRYAFATSRGYGMICRLQPDDPTQAAIYGTLYFGVGADGLVYHRCCEEQDDGIPLPCILAGSEIPMQPRVVDEEIPEEKFQIAGEYQVTISEKAVIRFEYPSKKYSVFVYPLRTDLLEPGLFNL